MELHRKGNKIFAPLKKDYLIETSSGEELSDSGLSAFIAQKQLH